MPTDDGFHQVWTFVRSLNMGNTARLAVLQHYYKENAFWALIFELNWRKIWNARKQRGCISTKLVTEGFRFSFLRRYNTTGFTYVKFGKVCVYIPNKSWSSLFNSSNSHRPKLMWPVRKSKMSSQYDVWKGNWNRRKKLSIWNIPMTFLWILPMWNQNKKVMCMEQVQDNTSLCYHSWP